jgi:3-hydroxybutyryl-CoA dehydrogenase
MEEDQAGWIRRVTVVGAGLMGHGIAQNFAVAGFEVALTDQSSAVLQAALSRIEGNLRLMAQVGRLSEERIPVIMARVNLEPNLGRAAEGSDFVCESISENLGAKQELFSRLDSVCPPRTILATNSSSFSLSQVGARIARRDKLIATHFLSPPHIIPLVEIMPGEETSGEVVQTTVALMRRCGQAPVILKKEAPGYVFNRLLAALLREAMTLVGDGIAEVEDVDLAVKAGLGLRMPFMGLLELADLAGLEVVEVMLRNVCPLINNEPTPPAILSEMVKRGELGGKSGKGFYDWRRRPVSDFIRWRDENVHRLRLALWEGRQNGQS